MKEIIPFVKEIIFKDKISSITSISLEHNEEVKEGEIQGEFIVFGDYKIHADTTEKELFKYRLPFTTIIPSSIDYNTIKVEIDDFTYDIIDDSIMKVKIDYRVEGKEIEKVIEDIPMSPIPEERDINKEPDITIPEEINEEEIPNNEERQIKDNIMNILPDFLIEKEPTKPIEKIPEETKKEPVVPEQPIIEAENEEKIEKKEDNQTNPNNEFVTYYIHIVKENETIEDIIKKYETNIENLKIYNDITNINIGDKLIIPEQK